MSETTRGSAEGSSEQVVSFVRRLIERGRLRPGDRLPAERDLATRIGVSRPTVRAGLHSLAALGVVHSKHGSGTYIPDGPPALRTEPLSFLAALHGFTREEMHEARRILEVGAAGLAAERATPEQLATLADEVAGMFTSLAERQVFLVHDVNFHRGVAAASANPIVAALVEMVSAMYYERRVQTVARAAESDMKDAAEAHRRIYQAIKARDVDGARHHMNAHLIEASAHQARELGDEPVLPVHPPASALPSSRRRAPAASRARRNRR
jgi:GntR family transcriptional regulator, transcriptional repressor for pyruvate dehydrogenase complex